MAQYEPWKKPLDFGSSSDHVTLGLWLGLGLGLGLGLWLWLDGAERYPTTLGIFYRAFV